MAAFSKVVTDAKNLALGFSSQLAGCMGSVLMSMGFASFRLVSASCEEAQTIACMYECCCKKLRWRPLGCGGERHGGHDRLVKRQHVEL